MIPMPLSPDTGAGFLPQPPIGPRHN